MYSYNLDNVEELLAFDEACVEAANSCPQVSLPTLNRKNEISVSQIFKRWFKSETLWSLGYNVNLNMRAKLTFNRYALFTDSRIIDSETGKIYTPKDKFRVKTVVIKEAL